MAIPKGKTSHRLNASCTEQKEMPKGMQADALEAVGLGRSVRITLESSEYYLLIGKVAEVTRFGYMIAFTENEMRRAFRPERTGKGMCYFERQYFQTIET